MKTTTIIYQNEEYEAYPLAEFKMADEAVCQRRGLFGRIKSATKEKERALALVFIPHRDRLGELAIIPRESSKRPTIAEYFTALSKDEKIDEKIAFCKSFVSSFTLEAPYIANYRITDFSGYKFILEYPAFISEVRNGASEGPLELLFKKLPWVLSVGGKED